VTAIPDM